MTILADAHIHLDFANNASRMIDEASTLGLRLFANSVTPKGYEHTVSLLGDKYNIAVGLGLHPWWVTDASLDDFERLLPQTKWIGEVGIDLSERRKHHALQQKTFRRIAKLCAEAGNKVLSIHSIRSASLVIDILEQTGCTANCTPILHWFSGSTEDLWRAIQAGCWFSINERQALTRRAREQLKLIPKSKLLLETDFPAHEGDTLSWDEVCHSLQTTLHLLEEIRKEQLGEQIASNWDYLQQK